MDKSDYIQPTPEEAREEYQRIQRQLKENDGQIGAKLEAELNRRLGQLDYIMNPTRADLSYERG
jgi:hypothetical protein